MNSWNWRFWRNAGVWRDGISDLVVAGDTSNWHFQGVLLVLLIQGIRWGGWGVENTCKSGRFWKLGVGLYGYLKNRGLSGDRWRPVSPSLYDSTRQVTCQIRVSGCKLTSRSDLRVDPALETSYDAILEGNKPFEVSMLASISSLMVIYSEICEIWPFWLDSKPKGVN